MKLIKRKQCCNCGCLFRPDPRNVNRQKYCRKSECRRASKAASQKKWFNKPVNQDYFSGPDNVRRVQEWRKNNPGYWRSKAKAAEPLQDSLIAQNIENKEDNVKIAKCALQDSLIMHPTVLIGLIANFTGVALQDDMVNTLLRLQQLGQDILNFSPENEGGTHDCKTSNFTIPCTKDPQKLQLDRSPPGP